VVAGGAVGGLGGEAVEGRGPVAPVNRSVTASFSSGAVVSGTGSPTISAPGATVTDRAPPKVSAAVVPGHAWAPPAERATAAAATRRGRVPYRLDSRIRTFAPPALSLTTWRSEWSPKPSTDQFGPSSSPPAIGRCIAAPQLCDQPVDRWDAACAAAGEGRGQAYPSPPISAAAVMPARGAAIRAGSFRLMLRSHRRGAAGRITVIHQLGGMPVTTSVFARAGRVTGSATVRLCRTTRRPPCWPRWDAAGSC
jgi:hypothetical protein